MQSGKSRRRVEDERFLRGTGRYLDDIFVSGALHGYVLRSPHAHAALVSVDVAAARAMPGVRGVFLAADLRADGVGLMPCTAKVATIGPIIVPPRPALAEGRVRYVGDAVAFVVAETLLQARDAAEAIEVEYDPLPAVADGAAALESGAPLLWDEAPGNLSFRFEKGDRAAMDAAFARAAHVFELEWVNNRVTAAPMEPRGSIASYDAATGRFFLETSAMGVHQIRAQLAQHVFNLPEDRITIVCPDVGGGFGAKNFLYPEHVMQMFAARRLGAPVRWVAERTEEFLATCHGRDNRTKGRIALDADGLVIGFHVQTVANLGAYMSGSGPGSSTNAPGTAQGGLYAIPAALMEVRGVFTNTTPIDAYRGAGKPEANYGTERLMDLAAARLGLDPVEFRRRNLIAQFPYTTAMGMPIDCGDFRGNLDRALKAADVAGFAVRRAESQARGMLRGLGLACFLETSRGAPGEWAAVRFADDGSVALAVGTQSNGQGHETSFPQIAADMLGLDIERFRLVQADTRQVPRGNGHGGARSFPQGGEALVRAIDGVAAKGRPFAAQLLQCAEDALAFAAGQYVVTGDPGRAVGFADVLAAAREAKVSLDAEGICDIDRFVYPNGCHVAEVEIDPETGGLTLQRYTAVDDYGRLVNPMLTISQVQGGLVQGIGQALMEECGYDAESAQPTNASMMDYRMPRADDLPMLDVHLVEVPTATNRLGVKGSGQAGAIGSPQTVMNAVLDALRPLGVEAIDMPATPLKIWQAIQAARGG